MAGEIQTQATSGETIYALVYNTSGEVYNGSAFETWNDGNVGSYDIPLAEQGGSGFYTGDFPIVGEGLYSVVARQQAGGSPSVSDSLVGAGNIAWSGSQVVSGVGGGSSSEYEINVGHSERSINVEEGVSESLDRQSISITKGNESTSDSGGVQITTGVDKV